MVVSGLGLLFEWHGSLITLNRSSLTVLMHGVTSYQWPTYWRSARDSVTVLVEGGPLGFAWGSVIGCPGSFYLPRVVGGVAKLVKDS